MVGGASVASYSLDALALALVGLVAGTSEAEVLVSCVDTFQ